ncbi:MAG: hypothetical protein R3F43_24925 [bacterium]
MALEDEASALIGGGRERGALPSQRLQAALTLSPDLEECHDLLADHHQGHAERARERGRRRRRGATACWCGPMIAAAPRRPAARRGYLSLEVATPGARIALHRHRTTMRREVPEFIGFLPSSSAGTC